MKRWAFFLFAPLPFVVACASPTAPSEGSITFTFSGGATPFHESLALSLWEEQKACTQWDGLAKRTVTIEVLSGGFICSYPGSKVGVLASGCLKPGLIQVDGRMPTYENALAHEYIHLVEQLRGQLPDYDHSGSIWAKCDKRNR